MAARTAAESPSARSSSREVVQSDLLADKLERWIIQSKSYWVWIIGILALAMIVAIVIALINGASDKREAEAWTEIYFAQGQADRLEVIAENYSGTTAGLWAMQKSGDATFSRAQSQIYLDRPIALQLLGESRQWYQSVLAEARDPLLIGRATVGVAQTYDAAGEVEQAANEYKRLLAMPEVNEQLKQMAAERVEFLESENGREFFAWYRDAAPSDPRPVDAADDLKQLPESDDLEFSPPGDSSTAVPLETPAAAETPAVGEIPAVAETTSAADTMPAAEATEATDEAAAGDAESEPAPEAAESDAESGIELSPPSEEAPVIELDPPAQSPEPEDAQESPAS